MPRSRSRRKCSDPMKRSRSRRRRPWIESCTRRLRLSHYHGSAKPQAENLMRIAYITAGAAGMFCGGCMHDNTLVSALIAQGHDALLIPTYTPIRTDEPDVSQKRVFF